MDERHTTDEEGRTTPGRIVIIDADPYSTELLEGALEIKGYRVQTVTTAAEARAMAPQEPPDLILMDLHLPDSDGLSLMKELKGDERTSEVPVILMSSRDDVDAKVKGFEHGSIDYITKPFEAREVLARVERQVTVSRVRSALRESEAKFRSVMESAIDAIISADAVGTILSWNRAATAVFGHTAGEAIGQRLELIIPERYRDAHGKGMARVTSGGPSRVIGSTVELSGVKSDGTEFPIELSLATWMLDEERFYTGIIRDISERKEAEQKFRSVTESAIDAIISADGLGRIVGWNTAATRMLGYTAEEAAGEPLEMIIPERFHDLHRGGMRRVAKGGESRVIGRTVEVAARTKEGREIPVELSLSMWTVHHERYFTGIIRDITERKEAEARLRAYADELESQHEALKAAQGQLVESEKQAVLGRLAAGLLHEIGSPLGALRSGADSLLKVAEKWQELVKEQSDEDSGAVLAAQRNLSLTEELAGVLTTSAKRIEEVVDGLRGFVSLDGAPRKRMDVRKGLEQVSMLLHSRLGKNIELRTRFPEEPVYVLGDPARLNQAFLTLLENAIEAVGERGCVEVEVTADPSEVQISVRDDGRGMSPEQIREAFEFGFSTKADRVHFRMGLATSKRSVEDAGGSITLESRVGEGTRARVRLPLG